LSELHSDTPLAEMIISNDDIPFATANNNVEDFYGSSGYNKMLLNVDKIGKK